MTWEEAIKQLDDHLYKTVDLICDGYNVTFITCIYRRQVRIMFYVDGIWKREYSNLDSEIGAKFGTPRYFRPSKKVIEFERQMAKYRGVKFNSEKFKKEQTKVLAYHPTHASPASVIQTLKKTCKDIQLVEK